MEILLFVIGLAILGYLGFVFMFPKAIPEDSSSHTKQVLKDIMAATDAANSSEGAAGSILRNQFEEEAELVKLFYSLPLIKALYPLQIQAGFQGQSGQMMIMLIALLFISTAFMMFSGFGPASFILGPLAAYVLPYKFFKRKVRKRNEKFIFLFPDVLDMIVRSVRSGFPITTAFKMVAENMEAPVKGEFEQVVSEISSGRTVNESLNRLASRINEPDINFFVVVLSVQQETGGNLAEVISNLSGIIRKRKQLRLKIRAMTSEGRATGWILGSLPVFVFFILFFIQRDYLEPLWTDPKGFVCLSIAIGLVVSCMWLVNRMIDIDI